MQLFANISSKVITLLVSCTFFAFVYLLLDDNNFVGINKVQDDIRTEIIKKEVQPKVDETDDINGFETFINAFTTKNELSPTEHAIKKQEKEQAIKEKTEDVKKAVEEQDLTPEKISPGIAQRLFDRLYFSISTGCLLGYGDIYPATNLSKTICMMQSMFTVSLIVS